MSTLVIKDYEDGTNALKQKDTFQNDTQTIEFLPPNWRLTKQHLLTSKCVSVAIKTTADITFYNTKYAVSGLNNIWTVVHK